MTLLTDIAAFKGRVATRILNKTAQYSILKQEVTDTFDELADMLLELAPDGILDGLGVTIVGPNTVTAPGHWKISGVVYNTTLSTTLAYDPQDALLSRYDLLYADDTGNIQILSGDLSLTPVLPPAPVGTITVATILITPTAVIIDIPPVTGFIDLTTNQIADGFKTFLKSPQVPDATTVFDAVNYGQWQMSLPNSMLSGAGLSIADPNIVIDPGSWRINGITYSTTSTTLIPYDTQDATLSRYDVIYADNSGTLNMISGVLSATPVYPDLPADTVIVGAALVTPTTVTTVQSPPTNFVQKGAQYNTITGEYLVPIVNPNGELITQPNFKYDLTGQILYVPNVTAATDIRAIHFASTDGYFGLSDTSINASMSFNMLNADIKGFVFNGTSPSVTSLMGFNPSTGTWQLGNFPGPYNTILTTADIDLIATVLTGMVTTVAGTTATTTAGTYRINNLYYNLGLTHTSIPAQDATLNRYTLLYIHTPGVISVSNSALALEPAEPVLADGDVEVALIYIPSVGSSVVTGGGRRGTGTVTRVNGANVNGFTWSIATATTTPTLTLNQRFASGSQSGQLSSADWTTFNNKLSSSNNIYNTSDTVISDRTVTLAPDATTLLQFVGSKTTGSTAGSSQLFVRDVRTGLVSTKLSSTNNASIVTSIVSTIPQIVMGSLNSTNVTSITIRAVSGGITILDQIGSIGFIYGADYSAANVSNPRWIPDKAYVDSVAGGAGTVSSISGVAANGFTWSIANATTTPAITLTLQNATTSQSGQLTNTDWNTFNGKQAALSGTGFVKSTGGTISYDTSTYLTTGSAAATYAALSGAVFTGNITLAGDATSALQPVSYGQFLNWNNGFSWKHSVIATTTGALPAYTTSGSFLVLTANSNGAFPAQDGVTLVVGDNLLVKNEAGAARTNNGGYVLTDAGSVSTPWILTRMIDSSSSAQLQSATYKVREGSTQAFQVYTVNVDPVVLGTTQITFALTGGAGTYLNGTGLSLSGNVFSIDASYTASASQTGYLSLTDWATFNGKANVNSQVFTGTPTLPTGTIATTQTSTDSSTKLATTAFVQSVATANTVYFSVTQFTGLGTSGSPLTIATVAPSYGGTGSTTTFTAGSVVFAGGSGIYGQDNSNFYWNSGSHILSVNTNGDTNGTNSINIYGQYDSYQPQSAIGTVTDAALTPGISASTSRGTGASPVINNTGDLIGTHSFWAYTGSSPAYTYMAGIVGTAVGATSTNLGGQLDFYVKANNGAASSAMTITNAGVINIPGLTASKFVTTDGSKNLQSTDLFGTANDFTALQRTIVTGVGTAGTPGYGVVNTDPATVGAQKYSPILYVQGSGWNTTVTAQTNTAAMGFQLRPIQGTSVTAAMDVMTNINGAGFTQSGIIFSGTGNVTAGAFNKVAITAPGTSATLTLITGSSLITAGAFALTLTSTNTTNATFPAGTGTLAYAAGTNIWTGLNTFQFGIATSGNANIAAGSTAGSIFNVAASTLTDNVTASGTVTNFAVIGAAQTTLAATNASITYTNGFGAYFTAPTNGTNVTMTNKYALGLAFDSTHLATFKVDSAGLLTLNATSTITITPATLISGAITFSSTIGTSNTNINVIANSASSNTNSAGYLFGGAANVNLKIALGCATSAGTIGATAGFANTLIAAAPLTGGTGTNPWVVNLAITPLGTITAGSGSITNAATLFVGAAPTAVATNKYTAYFDTGLNYMVGDLQLRHIIGNSAAPTIAAGTAAGTLPTVAVTGNDIAQKISVTTGTSPTASATVVTVTFNAAFTTNNPRIIITPANAVTAALTGTAQVFVDDASVAVGSYVIKVGSGGLAASTAYIWYVQVMQ